MVNIAVVKASSYQDLWVCPISSNALEILKTTLMRCAQIGLLELYNTEFIIVKESLEPPCQTFPSCISDNNKTNLKYSKTLKNPEVPFLDEKYHNHISIDSVSVDADSINWSKYNIVITINACIPNRIIDKYPNTLWCYYVGENDRDLDCLIGKYDVILNQDVMRDNLPNHSVGFPYTFLGPETIENINKDGLNNDVTKYGIFMEIKNTNERPVKTIPIQFSDISELTDTPIILHSQDIIENIKRLYGAKYYVKLFGSVIRGNSVLEAISAGVLVLANTNFVIYADLILDNCYVENAFDVITKIRYYDSNPEEYAQQVKLQRELLKKNYFLEPVNRLLKKFREKTLS
jgi:hypothetical protein